MIIHLIYFYDTNYGQVNAVNFKNVTNNIFSPGYPVYQLLQYPAKPSRTRVHPSAKTILAPAMLPNIVYIFQSQLRCHEYNHCIYYLSTYILIKKHNIKSRHIKNWFFWIKMSKISLFQLFYSFYLYPNNDWAQF